MRHAVVVVLAALFLFGLSTVPDSAVDATHPFNPDRRMVGLHPNPNGVAYYSLCTDDPVTQMLWAWGPESWETATAGAFYFNLITDVPCKVDIQEQIQWEYIFRCVPGFAACHLPVKTESDGDHDHLIQGKIVYDVAWWSVMTNAQKRAVAAHEMGHGVGLRDHSDWACDIHTIMGGVDLPPCHEVPTGWDAIAAMDAHGYFE